MLYQEIMIILSVALIMAFSPFIAKVIKIPTAPTEIILGVVFGTVGFIDHNIPVFELLAHFGFIYLMFLAGMEIDLKKFLKLPFVVFKQSTIYILMLYTLSLIFVVYFDFSKIFIVIFPLISIGLVATLSKEYGSKTNWVSLSMQSGILGEIVSIFVLTAISAMFSFGYGANLYKTILYLVLFLISLLLIFRFFRVIFWWYSQLTVVLMPHVDNKEQDVRLSFAILFLLLVVVLLLKIEIAFGAFIAGVIIPTFFEHKKELPEKLSSFGFGFLVPVFFIYVGSSFDISSLQREGLILKSFQIIAIMIFVRVVSSIIFYKKLGFKNCIILGLSHSMPLTLLIAIASLAYSSQSIDSFHYYAFVLASILEVIIATTSIKMLTSIGHKKG